MCKQKNKNKKSKSKIFSKINNLCDSLRGQVPLNEYINREEKILNLKFRIKPKKLALKNLKKEQNKSKRKQQEILMISVIVMIGLTFFSGISVGKAIYNTNLKNDTKIAKPVLEVEKDSEIVITKEHTNGEYHFVVKNYNQAEEISQVDLTYYIEILENHLDDSIKYELYKGDEKLELKENKTERMAFHKDIKEEQKYILKVTYDDSKNTMEDIIQDIQIKVHSEQLKI